jgi:hypothetical protein
MFTKCNEEKRYQVFRDEKLVGLANTHQEIADLVFVSRQHISNQLAKGTTVFGYGHNYIVVDAVKEYWKTNCEKNLE